MKEDFETFREEFIRYQKLFGLTGFCIYFKHEPSQDAHSSISYSLESMVATVRLNSKVYKEDEKYINIKRFAKHEALHLLIGRLQSYAGQRYLSPVSITEAGEELVNKLVDLVKEK